MGRSFKRGNSGSDLLARITYSLLGLLAEMLFVDVKSAHDLGCR